MLTMCSSNLKQHKQLKTVNKLPRSRSNAEVMLTNKFFKRFSFPLIRAEINTLFSTKSLRGTVSD